MLTLPLVARAEAITLVVGSDTTIYEGDAAHANARGHALSIGRDSEGSARRALLRFDVARAVPAGATITEATLSVSCSSVAAGATLVELHRLTRAWVEGASFASDGDARGAPASEHDATWLHRDWPSQAWEDPGGDYAREASAATELQGSGTYTWSSAELAADVQRFLDAPDQSFGWIMIGDRALDAVLKQLDSREAEGDAGPRLTLSYEPPSAPTGACCFSNGGCGVLLDADYLTCTGKYLGTNSACGPGACDWVEGACCALDATASCEARAQADCSSGFTWRGPGTSCAPNPCRPVLTPFVDPLPRLPVARPVDGEAGDQAGYRMRIVQLTHQLHRDLPPTKVWGYADGEDGEHGGSYPGPTIEARAGREVRVRWANDLRSEDGELLLGHALAIDTCLPGVPDGRPRTVMHLHGGHVPARADGQPDAAQLPGESTRYDYPNRQRAATLWYHDQALGLARLNATMGLAGFYLLRDDEEDALGLPKGEHEIPLVIQDRSLNVDGSIAYPTYWQDSFFGEVAVVNGKVSPFLEVDRGLYRFRLLNASTSRTYTLGLSNGRAFELIGNDGGLLPEAESVRTVTLSPGERADVVIDFEHAQGEVYLMNSALTPFPLGGVDAPITSILKLVVGDAPGHTAPLPTQLSTIEPLDENDAVIARDIVLARSEGDACGDATWLIDDLTFADVTVRPQLGTTEIWRFLNHSTVTQPMHVHMLHFQVLDRQPFALVEGAVVMQGERRPPGRDEGGWKDTVRVGPFEAVRVIARFEAYAGRYAYHSQLLEHQDHAMLRRFETHALCGDGERTRGPEQCDDGNVERGDGCDHECQLETDSDESDGGEEADASVSAPRRDAEDGCSVVLVASPARPWPAELGWIVFTLLLLTARRARAER